MKNLNLDAGLVERFFDLVELGKIKKIKYGNHTIISHRYRGHGVTIANLNTLKLFGFIEYDEVTSKYTVTPYGILGLKELQRGHRVQRSRGLYKGSTSVGRR